MISSSRNPVLTYPILSSSSSSSSYVMLSTSRRQSWYRSYILIPPSNTLV
uniref:Uncharacterized protein n=1 Tax=Arundo donax TaxID=35708 RepID=A0A0A9FFR5_ARUDO